MNVEPRLTRSEIKRAAIIDAAREEFLRCGFRDANMDVIAERAEVSKRTVYNHFPSKEELFGAIARALLEEFRQATQVPYDANRELRGQLLEFAQLDIELLTSSTYISIFRLFLVESHSSPEMVERILPAEAKATNPLVDWIEAAAKAGRLNVPDTGIAAGELHSMLKGALFWPAVVGYARAPSRKEKTTIIESAVDTFLSRYAANTGT